MIRRPGEAIIATSVRSGESQTFIVDSCRPLRGGGDEPGKCLVLAATHIGHAALSRSFVERGRSYDYVRRYANGWRLLNGIALPVFSDIDTTDSDTVLTPDLKAANVAGGPVEIYGRGFLSCLMTGEGYDRRNSVRDAAFVGLTTRKGLSALREQVRDHAHTATENGIKLPEDAFELVVDSDFGRISMIDIHDTRSVADLRPDMPPYVIPEFNSDRADFFIEYLADIREAVR